MSLIEKPPAEMMKSREERELDLIAANDMMGLVGSVASSMPTHAPEEVVARTEAIVRALDKRLRELGQIRQIQVQQMQLPPNFDPRRGPGPR